MTGTRSRGTRCLAPDPGREDGTVLRRARLTLEELPERKPWTGTEAWALKDINDFRD